ncbi:tetratricopeptide repeat protein [Pseudodesulfovibrio pelocollis]|uniref:tetratricopeptide repeat protein n=1 Tax=Pseudodesulfovibrio pelocollis TaxID=3051432 RepID=UPI00255B0E70|nr:tetratricopeptide repeat protein [Pseudodesulfovibrio sp. SB368]
MTRTYRLGPLLPLLLLILSLAGLSACAAKSEQMPLPKARALTPEARLNYDFLVYQDQLQRLQRHMAEGGRSPLTDTEVAEIAARAEAALDRLLVEAPTPQLYLEKAGFTWNDPEGTARSRQTLKDGLEKFPDDQLLTVYLANTYVMDDRVNEAVDVMEDYLSRKPDDHQARERLGQLLLDAGREAQALDALKKIPADQRSPDTLFAMGRAQGALGMRKAAIASLTKAAAMDETFTEALVELAYQYELAKDFVSAEKTYVRILERGEQYPEARLRIIGLNLKLNNPARALAVTLDGPRSKSFILDAVLMFINDGFFAQGSTALDMLTSEGEVPAEYYFYKAVIANDGEGDPAKALSFLGKVNPDDRLYPHALRFKAQMQNAMGKEDEALATARKGKAAFPDLTIFYILESALLKGGGDTDGAEQVLRQGLDRLKGDPDLSYELAMLYDVRGRRDDGLALMEGVLREHPDNSNALNFVGYTLAEEGRELERALVLVEKASLLDPENGYILDSVAWVHFKLGNHAKAWENIGYAVDIVDSDPVIWEHYGDIARAMGKKAEARKGYRNAIRLGSPHPDAVRKKLQGL